MWSDVDILPSYRRKGMAFHGLKLAKSQEQATKISAIIDDTVHQTIRPRHQHHEINLERNKQQIATDSLREVARNPLRTKAKRNRKKMDYVIDIGTWQAKGTTKSCTKARRARESTVTSQKNIWYNIEDDQNDELKTKCLRSTVPEESNTNPTNDHTDQSTTEKRKHNHHEIHACNQPKPITHHSHMDCNGKKHYKKNTRKTKLTFIVTAFSTPNVRRLAILASAYSSPNPHSIPKTTKTG